MTRTKKVQRSRLVNTLPSFLSVLLLAACGIAPPQQVLTKMQVERVTVPAALLVVPDEPAVPHSRMQSAAADYIVHLKINDDQCHLDVGAIVATQK